MKEKQKQQNMIHLGTHGEDYGNWMSNPVLYTIGGLLVVTGAVASLASTSVSCHGAERIGVNRRDFTAVVALLVRLDPAAVRVRRWRNDGARPPHRPFLSGF